MVDNLIVENWHVTGVLVVRFPHVHSVSDLRLFTNLFDNIVQVKHKYHLPFCESTLDELFRLQGDAIFE